MLLLVRAVAVHMQNSIIEVTHCFQIIFIFFFTFKIMARLPYLFFHLHGVLGFWGFGVWGVFNV